MLFFSALHLQEEILVVPFQWIIAFAQDYDLWQGIFAQNTGMCNNNSISTVGKKQHVWVKARVWSWRGDWCWELYILTKALKLYKYKNIRQTFPSNLYQLLRHVIRLCMAKKYFFKIYIEMHKKICLLSMVYMNS